ncbi:MAG: glycosyltransferase [Lachnospiraceae bacterium]|nr:glycosyltransferase [Lachnospiraceae bacterium]
MSIKSAIQQKLHERQLKIYEAELAAQKRLYEKRLKPGDNRVEAGMSIKQGAVEFRSFDCKRPAEGRYLILAAAGGYIDEAAGSETERYFSEHPELMWFYPDEDKLSAEGKPEKPWYKPDCSPETLMSSVYTGHILCVRKEAYEAAGSSAETAAGLVYALALHSEPGHYRDILYHSPEESPYKDRAALAAFLEAKGISAEIREDKDGYLYPVFALKDRPEISIIIPSKDHPEVLGRCVASIRKLSSYDNIKIYVTDNGSSPENKAEYEHLASEYGFDYHHEERPFNFSAICNAAARASSGEYLLFLNDDTETVTPDWLELMLGQAMQEGVGAVGAKLYYPGGKLIQHAGITNMYEGPVHKLFGMSDEEDVDRGRNRGIRDMAGVTAACMLVSRKVFEEAGGFPEELKVAYNDVDLCFTLLEHGLRCVVRNDVVLIHYESLSRGDDNIDDAKRDRLAAERGTLYERHPSFYERDPYYHPLLTGASERFEPAAPLENKNLPVIGEIKKVSVTLREEDINETLIIKRDRVGKCYYADTDGRRQGYIIDIHAHVRGLDSADYNYRMYAKTEDGSVYELPAVRRYRPDVEKTYYEQLHVELSGFAVKLKEGVLPPGRTEIWMEAKSAISRQRLVNRLEAV